MYATAELLKLVNTSDCILLGSLIYLRDGFYTRLLLTVSSFLLGRNRFSAKLT